MSKELRKTFEELVNISRDLRKWILKNGDPHTKIIVDTDSVEVLVGRFNIQRLYDDTKFGEESEVEDNV